MTLTARGNNHGCLSTDGKLKLQGGHTQPGNGSTDVVYTVSVVNEGSLSSTGPDQRQASFAPGLNPTLAWRAA